MTYCFYIINIEIAVSINIFFIMIRKIIKTNDNFYILIKGGIRDYCACSVVHQRCSLYQYYHYCSYVTVLRSNFYHTRLHSRIIPIHLL